MWSYSTPGKPYGWGAFNLECKCKRNINARRVAADSPGKPCGEARLEVTVASPSIIP